MSFIFFYMDFHFPQYLLLKRLLPCFVYILYFNEFLKREKFETINES